MKPQGRALIAAGAVLMTVGGSWAADPIGRIIAIEGVAVSKSRDGVESRLALKTPIHLHDKIVTEGGAKLQIMFIDETIIAQGEKSEMIIDEYVYSPAHKEENRGALSFISGFFRAVTGKIIDLNPDRFKVKTRMATIGIRGCDIGFHVEQLAENIYVIELPANRRIVIETAAVFAEGPTVGNKGFQTLEILHPGTAISISGQG